METQTHEEEGESDLEERGSDQRRKTLTTKPKNQKKKKKKNTPKSKHNPTERFGFVAHRKARMMKACRMQTILTELWG